MSIINDALKKTQSALLNKTSSVPPETEKEMIAAAAEKEKLSVRIPEPTFRSPILASPAPRKVPFKMPILLGITILFCITLLAGMIIMFNQISALSKVVSQAPAFSAPPSGIAIKGVMVRKNKTMAIINNDVYEVGETVNGLKIVSISLDRIVMRDGKKLKSFPVSKKK